jgi:hypothetical protein
LNRWHDANEQRFRQATDNFTTTPEDHMGLFSKIGKALGGIAKKVGGGLLKMGLGALKGKLPGLLGKLMDKFPLGKLLQKGLGILGKLGGGAAGAAGPLGLIGGLLGKIPGLGKLAEFATQLVGKLGGPEALQGAGQNNLAQMFAQAQAALMGNNRA